MKYTYRVFVDIQVTLELDSDYELGSDEVKEMANEKVNKIDWGKHNIECDDWHVSDWEFETNR